MEREATAALLFMKKEYFLLEVDIMEIVRIAFDSYNRKYVRELIPKEASPLEEWYPAAFCQECIEAPDSVTPNMLYDDRAKEFYDWVPFEEDTRFKLSGLRGEIERILNAI